MSNPTEELSSSVDELKRMMLRMGAQLEEISQQQRTLTEGLAALQQQAKYPRPDEDDEQRSIAASYMSRGPNYAPTLRRRATVASLRRKPSGLDGGGGPRNGCLDDIAMDDRVSVGSTSSSAMELASEQDRLLSDVGGINDDPASAVGGGSSQETRSRTLTSGPSDVPTKGPEDDTDMENDERFMNALRRIRRGLPVNVECRFVTAMDVIFLFVMVFVTTITIAAWHPNEFDSHKEHPPVWLIAIVLGAEVFTACWIYVRHFVRLRRGEWEIIESLPEIRKAYWQFWFWFDLIYTIPIELCLIGWADRVLYYTLFRHLLRYVRGIRVGNSVNPLLSGRRKGFDFVSYCCTLILAAHTIACIFWAMADENCESYITALYWATATLTGTGYGDIVATGSRQRLYAVICMVGGIITVASFTAFATKFVTLKNPIEAEKAKQKETMHTMMRYYGVPWGLQLHVMESFGSVLNHHDERQFRTLTEDLPEGLRDSLAVYFHAHLLHRVTLFAKVSSRPFVVALAQRMRRVFVAPFEFIFRQGESGNEMFFIIMGVVEVLLDVETPVPRPQGISGQAEFRQTETISVSTLRQMECFGAGALLETPHTRSASVQAKAVCELISLSYEEFQDVMRAEDGLTPAAQSKAASPAQETTPNILSGAVSPVAATTLNCRRELLAAIRAQRTEQYQRLQEVADEIAAISN